MMKSKKRKRRSRTRSRSRSRGKSSKTKRHRSSRKEADALSKCSSDEGTRITNNNSNPSTADNRVKFKSLSDTTMYSPAVGCKDTSPHLSHKYNAKRGEDSPNVKGDGDTQLITEFIKQIRIGNSSRTSITDTEGSSNRHGDHRRGDNRREDKRKDSQQPSEKSRAERAREDTEDIILRAEKYKADLAPEGMFDRIKKMVQANVDDEYFHTVCHIEPTIKEKIKAGEFVELEKLLVK